MKNIQNILLACVILLAAVGCMEDPLDGIVSHERAITNFNVEGQIGVAEITRAENSEVVVYVKAGTDLTQVAPQISVSYKAKVTPASGEAVNFAANGNQATYTVTAESGETRTWTVKIEEYEFDLGGTWQVSDMWFWWWIGEGFDWGWQEERPLEWNIPNAAKEKDNLLTFELEGVTEDGRLYGTYTFDAGADGEFADFRYSDGTDYNYKFRRIVPTTGTWERNFANNRLTFTSGDVSHVSLPLEFSEDNNTLTLTFSTGANDMDWGHEGNKQHVGAAKTFWYVMNRQ